MNVTAPTNHIDATTIQPERLAGNSRLTEREKITEASRQFEAVLLRQILESTQKTVISSKYTKDSTSSGIYRGLVTEQLADSISKSGAFGLAQTFESQLNRKPAADSKAGDGGKTGVVPTSLTPRASRPLSHPSTTPLPPHDP